MSSIGRQHISAQTNASSNAWAKPWAQPDGYLQQVSSAIRKHGGIAISDEVQVGYGRLGEWFWGFEQQQAVPDIVAVAKSVGGGQPIGVVITRREIADRYRTGGYFFSSTGGSPVSSAIGLAVLDVIQQEGLQENARTVGTHLTSRLLELGVVMQPTGDFQNVLKIKPPLCISQESVDYFVDSLDRALTTGW